VNTLMSLIIMARTVFFHSKECRVVLNWFGMLYSQLVLDGINNFVDGEPQWSEVFFHLEGLEWIR